MAYHFGAPRGFSVSANAVRNARGAIRSLPRASYGGIPERIPRAAFARFDGSAIRMNGKRGYAWPATAGDAAYPAAAPGRGAAVPGPHFGGLPGMPAVTDGYAAYGVLPARRRRRVRLPCGAEKHAVKNDGDDPSCYRRLPSTYGRIKNRESADGAECLNLEEAALRMASGYGEGRGFRATPENAARARSRSRGIRACPRTTTPPGRGYATPWCRAATRATGRQSRRSAKRSPCRYQSRAYQKVGMFPRAAVERAIEDPDWRIFKPPDCRGRVERPVRAATAAPSAAATAAPATAAVR